MSFELEIKTLNNEYYAVRTADKEAKREKNNDFIRAQLLLDSYSKDLVIIIFEQNLYFSTQRNI